LVRTAVALGANLDDPAGQLRAALDELSHLPRTRREAASSLYRTAPVGLAGQPDYCNAVAILATELSAGELLRRLQGVENAHGRRRGQRWGPRTLDLDVLDHAGETRHDPHLTLPHPRLAERAFVLVPWAEIAPRWRVPGLGPVAELAARVDTIGVRLWDGD
jgi:2-amino-4-hydroxy-6-hydroxymethyldihydropteridine diphosphokinase